MPYDHRNLANTVGPRRRMPCEVGWAIDPYANGGRTWTWCHQWGKDGRCLHCRKTVKQILEPRAPRPPKPRKARPVRSGRPGLLRFLAGLDGKHC